MKYARYSLVAVFVVLRFAMAQDTISSNPVWIPLNSTPRDTGTFVATQSVNALALHDGKLFVGGSFKKIGPLTDGGVMQLENGSWKKIVDVGLYGTVNAFAFDTSHNLLFGGDIDTSRVFKAFNFAMWDGNNVLNLKTGVRDPVRAIAVDEKNNYYVGGDVHETGAMVNYYLTLVIAKWDGTAWSSYFQTPEMHCVSGSPCPLRGQGINSIVSDYSKGIFYTGYTCNQPYSERYNCPDVFTVDFEGNLYSAGGMLVTKNKTDFPGLCKETWTPSGSTTTDTTFPITGSYSVFKALVIDRKGNLFFGGEFSYYQGVRGIGVWNGKTVRPLGKGVKGMVKSLALDETGGMLYVGGDFDSAGGKFSPMIAAVDLYHSEIVKNAQYAGQIVKRLELKTINGTVVVSGALAQDRISLYSLSGRVLVESGCFPALQLRPFLCQPVIAVVKRGPMTLISQVMLIVR